MMTFSYQSAATVDLAKAADDSLWHLGSGQALSLPSQPAVRQLRVSTGRLWVTFSTPAPPSARRVLTAPEAVDLPLANGDHWLGAGQNLSLPAHASAVLEGWPQATFSVREMPLQAQAQRRLAQPIRGRVGVPGRCGAPALT